MTMPPDPTTSVPSDPTRSPQDALYGDALDAAQKAELALETQIDGLNNQLSGLGPRPNDTDALGNSGPLAVGWDKKAQAIDADLKMTTGKLADAKRTTAGVYTKIFSDSTARARLGEQSDLWARQAVAAQAAANLKNQQASLLTMFGDAKDQAGIDKINADIAKSQQQLGLIAQQTQTSASQAAVNNARAVQIAETTPAVLQLDAARTTNYGAMATASTARAGLYGAQAAKAQAQADVLIPAQANKLLKDAGWDDAKIAALNLKAPATIAELAARTGLEEGKLRAINANISKQQVLPYADVNAPRVDVFQPSTGQLTGVDNPAYKNPYLQPLTDRAAAIESIKNDLASGKFGTGPDALDYANQLIAGVSQSALLQAKGFTPEQYQQAQNAQAQMGQGILSGIQSQGRGMADTLLQYAGKARGLGGFTATPYQNAIGMAGGPDIVQKAMDLIKQIQPINDRNSAVDAISRYGAASALLKASQSGGGDQTQAPADQGQQQQDTGPGSSSGYGTPQGFSSGTDDQSGMRQMFLSGALGGAR